MYLLFFLLNSLNSRIVASPPVPAVSERAAGGAVVVVVTSILFPNVLLAVL
jgi:hypothetical protein